MDEPLQYRSKGLHVSELAQQLWCEKRVELELLYGKEETPEMARGSERHRELFEEITPVFEVRPETWVDEFFVRLHQMWSLSHKILSEGRARELPVYGKISTMMLKGIIDELVIKDGEILITETKTRASGEVPDYRAYERVVEFQVSLYKLMFDNIRKGHFSAHDVLEFYRISPDTTISESLANSFPEDLLTTNVEIMAFIAFETVRTLPESSDIMVVHYENQNREPIGTREFTFDGESVQESIDFVLGFWNSTRAAVPPLKNPWKCDFCPEKLRENCDAYCELRQYKE